MNQFKALCFLGLMTSLPSYSAETPGPQFEKVFVVVLENSFYSVARSQKFLRSLEKRGASLDNMRAIGRPSQVNYLALTAGSTFGVNSNQNVDLDVHHILDQLDSKGKTWKVYAEDFPGNCFLGAKIKKYVRKHVPFISYLNIQKNPERCSKIVSQEIFAEDLKASSFSDFSFFVPNLDNDGHDTGTYYADNWMRRTFSSLFKNTRLMEKMLFVVTFDESSRLDFTNHIFTAFLGANVNPGARTSARYDLYDLLRTIQHGFGLGTLGQNDDKAKVIGGIWR